MPLTFSFKGRLNLIIHLLGWATIILIPHYLVNAYGGGDGFRFLNQFYFNTAIYGLLFYVNYLWLAPRLFLKDRKLTYFVLTAALVLVLYFVMNYVNEHFFSDPEHEARMKRIFDALREEGEDARPPIHQLKVYSYFYTSLLICGFSLGLSVLERLAQNAKERKELEKEKLNTELAFLKSQVSPHFFFNTLNNIYSLIEIDSKEAQDAVLKLSKLMRYLLYESEGGSSSLADEINFMKHYIDLMKLRISNKVDLKVDFPADVPELRIPPLLFIAFVENSFKHGISYREPSFIEIKLEVTDQQLLFQTRNSLVSSGVEGEARQGGIGLENVSKRLKLIYPDAHELYISRTNDTFKVKLAIDYRKVQL